MTLTIGRFGLDLAAGTVASTDADGGTLKITGRTAYSDMEQARALEQQILGYVDNADESFVPVTWEETPQINGFYRVTGASVGGVAGLAPAGILNFTVTLARVQGFAAPLIEDVIVGAVRPSALGLTGIRWVGIPQSAKSFVEYHDGAFTGYGDPNTVRVGETSSVGIYRGIHDSCIAQFYIPVESYYDGSVSLQVAGRTVAGRQVPNKPTEWLLSNDLMQLRVAEDTFRFEYRKWNGTVWSAWHTLEVQSSQDLPFPEWTNLIVPHTITVLRNSPELVVIRLVSKLGTFTGDPLTIDVSLRRGSRTFAVQYHATRERLIRARVGQLDSASATTGGWKKQLTAGSTGEVLVFGSPRECLYGSGSGVGTITPSASGERDAVAAWAFTFGDSTSVEETDSFNTDVSLREYFWAGTDKQTVVAQ